MVRVSVRVSVRVTFRLKALLTRLILYVLHVYIREWLANNHLRY